jgi:Tetratricopeptide repeat
VTSARQKADRNLSGTGKGAEPRVAQEFLASGQAQQAVQGAGIQNVYIVNSSRESETVVSVAPPFGQRNENLPLRGRDELLSELACGNIVQRIWVIHGLGGSGKTRLALEAAFRAEERGVEVWWVPAVDPEALIAGMRAVGHRLGIAYEDLEHGDAADLIWQRLAVKQDPWLLVIDGADDPQVLRGAGSCVADGRGWLRPLKGQAGMVLLTSRDGSEDWGPWCNRHRLGMLSAADAAAVLADHAGRYPRLGGENDAQELGIRLGGLPLALRIVGSYLASTAALPLAFTDAGTITTYQSYREAMDDGQTGLELASSTRRMTHVEIRTLIGRIWEITLDRLDARQMPEGRQILQLLATFADAPLPYELLLNPETLAASQLFSEITGPRLWEVMTALDSFGLLELSQATWGSVKISVVQLHPLVRDTSRTSTGSHDRIIFLELISRLLEQAGDSQDPDDPQTWPTLQLLAPHIAEVFHELADAADCSSSALQSAATAANVAARYRSGQGLRAQAEALYRAVLEVRTRILGPDNLSTLATRHQLAHEIAARGDHATAEAEHRAVLEAETRILGPDGLGTLITRHCLAHEIAARGDHATAEAEHRAVLEAQIRILGPDAPRTLNTRRCLAQEIAELGDHAAAEAELQAILEVQTRILGLDHPFTLHTRYELAWQIALQGDHVTAEAEYRAVLEAETRIFGPEHPSTLETRFDLALQLSNSGDHLAAEAELRAVLEAQLRIFGPDAPRALGTRRHLAREIRHLGDHSTAEAEYNAVLEAETRILGPDNPSTLTTRHWLAHEIARRGDRVAAEAEFQAVLEAQTRILGPDNPDTLETRSCLAGEIAELGDRLVAEAEFRAVLEAQTRILGSDNPSTVKTRDSLAAMLRRLT